MSKYIIADLYGYGLYYVYEFTEKDFELVKDVSNNNLFSKHRILLAKFCKEQILKKEDSLLIM